MLLEYYKLITFYMIMHAAMVAIGGDLSAVSYDTI
jgi:hypothetical protein